MTDSQFQAIIDKAVEADIEYLDCILAKLEQFDDYGARYEAQSVRNHINKLKGA